MSDFLTSFDGRRSVSTNVTVHGMLLLPDGREFARVLIDAPAPEQWNHDGRSWRRREKTLLGRWTYQLIPARLRKRR